MWDLGEEGRRDFAIERMLSREQQLHNYEGIE